MTRRQLLLLRNLVALLISIMIATPHLASAQRASRFAFGIGAARFLPLRPLASDATQPVDYELDGAGVAVIAIDYWFTNWLATRASYQWFRTDIAQPEGPSFARISSGYGGVLIAPIRIANLARPYGVLGAGIRRYDVNAGVFSGTTAWDIAPRQNRFAGYGGLGIRFRAGQLLVVPEAGAFLNTFRHKLACADCSGQRQRQLDLTLALQVQFQ